MSNVRRSPHKPVLSETALARIKEKIEQAMQIGFAEVTLVIEHGRLRRIRGPAPSELVED